MFLIPLFFFIANFCLGEISKVISSSFSGNGTIADYLWHLGDPKWNGNPSGTPGSFGPPPDIKSYNFIAEIFGVWFMLYAIVMIGLIVVQKVIELFFLFIISPIVMVTMVCDDGKRVFVWKDMFIAKFLASTGVLIGFNLFMIAIHTLMTTAVNGLSGIAREFFIVLFLCGGALSLLSFSNIIAALVGEAVGITESMNSMQSVMGGLAFTAGGAKMVGKAIGVVRTERNKRKMGQNNNSNMNFDQEFAGTNKVQDSGQQGIQMPDNWTRRGIPGLLYGTVGVVAGVGTAVVAATKSSGLHGKNKFTRGFKKVGGAFGRPITNSSRKAKQFLKQETNPEWKNITKQRYKMQTKNLGDLYETKNKKFNNKINRPRDRYENKIINKIVNKWQDHRTPKWNKKIIKYNKKSENLENFLNKKKNKK